MKHKRKISLADWGKALTRRKPVRQEDHTSKQKQKSTTETQITRSANTRSQPTVGPTQVKRTKDPKQGRYVKLWEGRI